MSKVSVIIPAYNKSDYTCRAIDSVLRQTYQDIEIIVVDDGSTDDTQVRLKTYLPRIQYIRKDNGGACSARNVGIRSAKGKYIALLDCDDLYLPNKIEESVKFLEANPSVGFVHTMAYLIGRDDSVETIYARPEARENGWIAHRLIFGNFICNSTVLTRRSCLDDVGLFDETIFTPADWDLWLRLAEHYKAAYIDIPLTKYRVTDNYIFHKLELSQKEEAVVIERYFQRNPSISTKFKNTILSSWHLRYAQCYVIKEDAQRVREELKKALAFDPWNVKGRIFCVLYACARPFLNTFLKKKIVRTQEGHR
jgi:glycosyltransferase involved in cell wall biosynthesis